MRTQLLLVVAFLIGCSDNHPNVVPSPKAGDSSAGVPSPDIEALEEFRQAAAQVGGINALDSEGKTALIRAIEKRHGPSVKYLLEKGANPEAANNKGGTPILFAVAADDLILLELLHKHGVKLTVPSFGGRIQGVTLLHIACSRKAMTSVRWLVSKGVDINAKDGNGETPLMTAFSGRVPSWAIVDELIRAGADAKTLNRDGKTLTDIAINAGALVVARKLNEMGVGTSPNEPTIDEAWPRTAGDPHRQGSYLERQAKFKTRLKVRGPAPAEGPGMPPRDVEQVNYTEGDLKLKAWLIRSRKHEKNSPVFVYFHGGFALDESDIDACQAFIDEGYSVLMPMYRGENGNPGYFELMFGEVDDAAASIAWIAKQSFVDPARIVIFGHSAGGGIADLLTLRKGINVQCSGSCGSLYTPQGLMSWAIEGWVPFDTRYFEEFEIRTLLPHLDEMQRDHYAYRGTQDRFDGQDYLKRKLLKPARLRFSEVQGDHASSLPLAVQEFLKVVKALPPSP